MKKFLTLFAAAAALVACNKAADTPKDLGSREVKFTVSNLYTVTTKAAINNGSYVAIFAGDPINKSNVKMTVTMEANASSGSLSPYVTNSLLWGGTQTTEETDFFAIYPYEDGRALEGETEKYLAYDIASASDVDYANDFLSAVASQAPGTGETPAAVALAFKHPFAKLVYNISNTSDDFVSGVKISGIRRTGHIMSDDGTAVPTGDPIAADAAVALNPNGEVANSFMTVVMPEASAVNPLVVVEMVSGAKYSFTLSAARTLEAGKVYTASIAISGSHGTEESDRTVTGTFTVTDWENVDAGSMTGGTVTPATSWWYLVGNIDNVGGNTDGAWSKYIPFKCIGDDLWQVDFYFAGGTGFKLMYAANPPEWNNAYGMSSSDTWVIDPEYVYAEGAGNDYWVHGLTNEGGQDINMSGTGNFRIKFTPSIMEFYIYTLD